jgi:hypothetical protein
MGTPILKDRGIDVDNNCILYSLIVFLKPPLDNPNHWNRCPATWTTLIQQSPLLDALMAKDMIASQVSNHVLNTDLIKADAACVTACFDPILKENKSKQ